MEVNFLLQFVEIYYWKLLMECFVTLLKIIYLKNRNYDE